MQVGNFDEAKQVDFEQVGPQFDLMQHQVQIASGAEEKWAESIALQTRNELLVIALLVATAILILFLCLQKQEHIDQLEIAERTTLRESEERFRALTEQSADIILIADSSGRIQYASPSVQTILGVRGGELRRNEFMIGIKVHPDDFAKTMRIGLEALGRGQKMRSLEFRLRHADGEVAPFQNALFEACQFITKT